MTPQPLVSLRLRVEGFRFHPCTLAFFALNRVAKSSDDFLAPYRKMVYSVYVGCQIGEEWEVVDRNNNLPEVPIRFGYGNLKSMHKLYRDESVAEQGYHWRGFKYSSAAGLA